jgi:hypothetical protein
MNGQASKMLRKMKADGNKDKDYWNSLPHTERSRIGAAFRGNKKLAYINFLAQHRVAYTQA